MPATNDTIARMTRENIVVTATSTQVQTNHGTAARDNSADPIVTFYNGETAALALVTERLGLMSNPGGTERRIGEIEVNGIVRPTGSLESNVTTPTVYVEDPTTGVANNIAVVGFKWDFARERTVLTLLG